MLGLFLGNGTWAHPVTDSAPELPSDLRARWTGTYASTPYQELPWFSYRPAASVVGAVSAAWWSRGARILDVGCGAGTNALFLAREGFHVTGVDVAEGAIQAAQSRARRARLKVGFCVADALRIPVPDGHFDGAIDIGCFHTLPLELRAAYATELARVVQPGSTFLLSWVAREHQDERGPPHRPSLEEVAQALEERFLFLRTEFRPGAPGRKARGGPAVYWARLLRRSVARPPRR